MYDRVHPVLVRVPVHRFQVQVQLKINVYNADTELSQNYRRQ